MGNRLRVPAVLAMVVLGGGAAVVSVAALPSCGSGTPPVDAAQTGYGCDAYCLDDVYDGGTCPIAGECASASETCPPGCRPVG
jgi:hypothetical protein